MFRKSETSQGIIYPGITQNSALEGIIRNIEPVSYPLISYNSDSIDICSVSTKRIGNIVIVHGYISATKTIGINVKFMHLNGALNPPIKVYFPINIPQKTTPAYAAVRTDGYIASDYAIDPGFYFFNFSYALK